MGKEKAIDNVIITSVISAAGFASAKRFFKSLPESSAATFFILVHDNSYDKIGDGELSGIETSLTLEFASVDTKIRPNHIYIIPSDELLTIHGNRFFESDVSPREDVFSTRSLVSSLFKNTKNKTAGIIFSNGDSEGAAGLESIEAAGGMVVRYDEKSDSTREIIQKLNGHKSNVHGQDADGLLKEESESTKRTEDDIAALREAHKNQEMLEAADMAVLFIDHQLRVIRFTNAINELFDLSDANKGTHIDDVSHVLEYVKLSDDLEEVMATGEAQKRAVCTSDGRWFIMQLRPYHSENDEVDGAIATFTDFTELKEARETIESKSRQESLAELGMYALERNDMKGTMDRAIDLSCIVLELDCAVILTLDEEQNSLEMGAHAGCGKSIDPIAVDEDWDVCFAMQNTAPVVVTDYDDEERFACSPFLKDSGFVSSVHVVIRGLDDSYGVFGFYSSERKKFTESDIIYIQVIANIVGSAIERHQNHEKMIEKNRQLQDEMKRSRKYQKDALNNNLVERWELGSYLHDNLAQMLASAKILAEDIEQQLSAEEVKISDEIWRIKDIIDKSIKGINDLSQDIIPVDIEVEGVEHAFRFLIQQVQKVHGVQCTLLTGNVINEIKNRKLATHLYHVVQEAIKNAILNNDASEVTVSFQRNQGDIVLQIEDNGDGTVADDESGEGIRIMKHRIELLGGDVNITKLHDPPGICVTCTLPLASVQKQDF